MLTEVKNQLKITALSIKYALMREMVNKFSFIFNILFMVLNNGCMIIEWIILFSIKETISGYGLKEVILLWGLASGTYGVSHFFFRNAFNLSDIITNGKLDAFIVQPKNVLLSAITTDVEPSALGDMLYAYICLFVYGFSIKRFLLFTLFIFTGGIICVCVAVILGSLAFYITKSDLIANTGNSIMINFATYPDGIFKGFAKILLMLIIPLGYAVYMPFHIILDFNLSYFLISIGATIGLIALAFYFFNKGLHRYSSSNLMIART